MKVSLLPQKRRGSECEHGAEWDTGDAVGGMHVSTRLNFLGSNGSRQARPPTILTHLWRSLFLWPFTSPSPCLPRLVAGGTGVPQAWARPWPGQEVGWNRALPQACWASDPWQCCHDPDDSVTRSQPRGSQGSEVSGTALPSGSGRAVHTGGASEGQKMMEQAAGSWGPLVPVWGHWGLKSSPVPHSP